MDDELREEGAALVGQSSVPEKKPIQISEGRDREITGQSSLNTLLTVNTHSHVSRLYEGDVVATISDA